MVVQAENVAGIGHFSVFALGGHEGQRIRDFNVAAQPDMTRFHPGLIAAGTNPQKGDAVAVLRVHVRLNLEHETGECFLFGGNLAAGGRVGTWRRRVFDKAVQHLLHPEVGERRAEKHRSQPPGQIFLGIKRMAGAAHQFNFLTQRLGATSAQFLLQLRTVQSVQNVAGVDPAIAGRVVKVNEILIEMVNAFQIPAHANRPGHGRTANFQHIFHFVEQINRFAAITIQLVDKGENRGIAQAADFHQLDGALFNALGAVNHHQRGIHRRQGAVGILGKILVTGGVEQIDDVIAVGKLHHRRGDGDAALLFQFHPVAGGVTSRFAAFNRAGQLDRAAEQQQFFGERGFAGVRVGNNGEGAPPLEGVKESGHRGLIGVCNNGKKRDFS